MNYTLVYYDEVRLEVREAKRWYHQINPALANRFANAVKEAISSLAKHPTANSIRYRNVRISYPKFFPYAIHYYIDETSKHVVIVAIIHTARDQDFIKGRT